MRTARTARQSPIALGLLSPVESTADPLHLSRHRPQARHSHHHHLRRPGTGATKGIGLETCKVLADAGADIAAVGRDPAGLAEVKTAVEAKGRRCVTISADMATVDGPVKARPRRPDSRPAAARPRPLSAQTPQ